MWHRPIPILITVPYPNQSTVPSRLIETGIRQRHRGAEMGSRPLEPGVDPKNATAMEVSLKISEMYDKYDKCIDQFRFRYVPDVSFRFPPSWI